MSMPMQADPTTLKIQTMKAQVESAKAEKNRAEARMEELTKQRDGILTELQALNVTPENLDTEIAQLEAERDQKLAEAEELLKGVA